MNSTANIERHLTYTNDSLAKQEHLLADNSKTFTHHLEIFLKDSNAYGNTYFARHFEWQGICREKWFRDCVARDMLQTQGVLITKCAHQTYLHETFPFDSIECRLNSFDIKQCSFRLLFEFFSNGRCISSGYQHIVFASFDRKIIRLPKAVIAKVKEYETTRIISI